MKALPAWAQEFAHQYGSKTANLYILHGNIRDFFPYTARDEEYLFARLQDYISDALFSAGDIIIYYDRSGGVSFGTESMARDYMAALKQRCPEGEPAEFIAADPVKSFAYLEKYILFKILQDQREKRRIVLIADYAETIAPAGDLGGLSGGDRASLVTLSRWAWDAAFTQGDVSILLLAENLDGIAPLLTDSPAVVKVHIPLPNEELRTAFLRMQEREGKLFLGNGVSPERAAAATGGLSLVNLNRLVSEGSGETKPLTLEYVRQQKKELIERETLGLLDFPQTGPALSYAAGHSFVKKRLKNAVRAVKMGRPDMLPAGYLIAGPGGTGKSFMVRAFAAEAGIPLARLNLSRRQGSVPANLEKAMNILIAMAPAAALVDDADLFLADAAGGSSSGGQGRFIAQVSGLMGREYRGRLIWFFITSRPDRIPACLKRRGLLEERLTLFNPGTDKECEALFNALVRKLNLTPRNFSIIKLLRKHPGLFSGADLESILIKAGQRAAMANRPYIDGEDIEDALENFVPPAYPYELELQTLTALLDCVSPQMAPSYLRRMSRAQLIREIGELKALLGED